jgi:hypothetical protein
MEQKAQCLSPWSVAAIKLLFRLQLAIKNTIQCMSLPEIFLIQQDVAMEVAYCQLHSFPFRKVALNLDLTHAGVNYVGFYSQ